VALGLIGMLLAAVGIYGVVGYFVTLRTHEIGIRMALGATARHVLTMLAWQGMAPICIGIVVGSVLAAWATGLMRQSLYGITTHDPLTYVVVVLTLLAAGALATVVPARRATRVDVNRTLQGQG
jgi:putative ABC transport system permease protein